MDGSGTLREDTSLDPSHAGLATVMWRDLFLKYRHARLAVGKSAEDGLQPLLSRHVAHGSYRGVLARPCVRVL